MTDVGNGQIKSGIEMVHVFFLHVGSFRPPIQITSHSSARIYAALLQELEEFRSNNERPGVTAKPRKPSRWHHIGHLNFQGTLALVLTSHHESSLRSLTQILKLFSP